MKVNDNLETWVVIEDNPTYEISNLGRVRSHYLNGNNRILTPSSNGQQELDYLFINLDGKKRYIHQLVLEAFVGKKPSGFDCDHKNGKRTDNTLNNLRYLPLAENRSHKGEAHPLSKLTEAKVKMIRMMYASKESLDLTQKKLANLFEVSTHTISNIICNRSWSHI